VWAPFFGRPAYTMTLAARLVQQTGATLLLTWASVCRAVQAMCNASSSFPNRCPTILQIAAAINRSMERLILHARSSTCGATTVQGATVTTGSRAHNEINKE